MSQPPQGAGRRILVVEDEDQSAPAARRTLERLGCPSRPPRPIGRAADAPGPGRRFALVISDMMMPHTTGAEFAREVATWMPELPFSSSPATPEDVAAQAGAIAAVSLLAEALHLGGARGRRARRARSSGPTCTRSPRTRVATSVRVQWLCACRAHRGASGRRGLRLRRPMPPAWSSHSHIPDGKDVRSCGLQQQRSAVAALLDASQSSR